jgi:hypothetical protein
MGWPGPAKGHHGARTVIETSLRRMITKGSRNIFTNRFMDSPGSPKRINPQSGGYPISDSCEGCVAIKIHRTTQKKVSV